MLDITLITTRNRIVTYWVAAIGLTAGYAVTRGTAWVGNEQLHTLMETVATLLAATVGVMALVRYYSKKDNMFLFIGAGFLGTAFLDGYHAVVTSAYFKPFMPSDLPALIPWSWVASRQFLSILMFLSWLAWLREERLGDAGRIGERTVYLFTGVFTLASFLFFAFTPLPRAYYPEIIFHRPEEFLPALFFLLALVGYLRKGQWRDDSFEHWLVLSLIVGLVGQVVFMSFSGGLFDFEFDAAHTLKKVSYVCVLTGLLISMHSNFRRAEESDSRFRGAIASLQEGFALFDSDDRLVICNEEYRCQHTAAQAIIKPGIRFEDLVRSNAEHIILPEGVERREQYIRERIAQHHHPKIPIVCEFVDGTSYIINEAKTPDGGIALTQTDITGLKRVEKNLKQAVSDLQRSNHDLEQFAYVASHDLQEPLRMVASYTELLAQRYEGRLDERADKYIGHAVSGAKRMQILLNDLLAYSRAGTKEETSTPTDIMGIVNDVVGNLASSIAESGAEVRYRDLPPVVGEPAQLVQIFQNLVANAIKFRGSEPPKIEISAKANGAGWKFTVSDNGIGINPEHFNRIFTIFQRLHPRDAYEGTGLGLAIVKKLVERHGGRISVESEPGQGATFLFTLPRATDSRGDKHDGTR